MRFIQQNLRVYFLIITLIGNLILPIGCSSTNFLDPVTKFQKASSVVISSTRLYISELNKSERDHYIQKQLGSRSQIKENEMEAAEVFSKDGIKARLDALNQLESYADLLLSLTSNDTPQKIQSEAQDLGSELSKLSVSVSSLTKADDANFKSSIGPVSTIVGEVLSLISQSKIKDALTKAVKEGRLPVNNLLVVIRNDISLAYERKRNSLSEQRVILIDAYNDEMSKGAKADPEKMNVLSSRISSHEDKWETFANSNPGDGLNAMINAHDALVKYAESGQKIIDIATLNQALEAFEIRAESLGKAVKALHDI